MATETMHRCTYCHKVINQIAGVADNYCSPECERNHRRTLPLGGQRSTNSPGGLMTTVEAEQVPAHRSPNRDVQPGDVVGTIGGQLARFVGWADESGEAGRAILEPLHNDSWLGGRICRLADGRIGVCVGRYRDPVDSANRGMFQVFVGDEMVNVPENLIVWVGDSSPPQPADGVPAQGSNPTFSGRSQPSLTLAKRWWRELMDKPPIEFRMSDVLFIQRMTIPYTAVPEVNSYVIPDYSAFYPADRLLLIPENYEQLRRIHQRVCDSGS